MQNVRPSVDSLITTGESRTVVSRIAVPPVQSGCAARAGMVDATSVLTLDVDGEGGVVERAVTEAVVSTGSTAPLSDFAELHDAISATSTAASDHLGRPFDALTVSRSRKPARGSRCRCPERTRQR